MVTENHVIQKMYMLQVVIIYRHHDSINGNAIARVFQLLEATAIYPCSKATKILKKIPHNFEDLTDIQTKFWALQLHNA